MLLKQEARIVSGHKDQVLAVRWDYLIDADKVCNDIRNLNNLTHTDEFSSCMDISNYRSLLLDNPRRCDVVPQTNIPYVSTMLINIEKNLLYKRRFSKRALSVKRVR